MKDLLDYINAFQKLDSETEQVVQNPFVEEKFKNDRLVASVNLIEKEFSK